MTIPLADAMGLVLRRCRPVGGVETVPLDAAGGRILAQPVVAPIALPPADNAAVDGYAFRHADLARAGAGGFRLAGVAAAGRPFAGALGPGEAVRILTGAVPPEGADCVAMQEDAVLRGERVILPSASLRHAHIRRAGEEIAAGAQVFAAGERIGPAALGILAALGLDHVTVQSRLRVALISAGDELVRPGDPLRHGAIYDSNRPVLAALLAGLGCLVTDLGILPDRPAALAAALDRAALSHDTVLCTGGISVGDEDHVCAVVSSLGGMDFRGVAIKPGRPTAFGHVGDTPFFGLPGNPVAMLVAFLMLARPGLIALAGGAPRQPLRFPAVADFALRKTEGRREILRCHAMIEGGALRVRPHALAGAAILSSVAQSDGLVEIGERVTAIEPGATLLFTPFSEYGL